MLSVVVLGQIGLGWLFIRYLIQQDRGPKEPPKALWFAGILGLVAIPIAIFGEMRFVSDIIVENQPGTSVHDLAIAAFMVGLIEELAKSLPLALWIFKRKFFDEMTDGVIYFAITGMVFGVAEDISYTLSLGPGVGVVRIIMAPYIHASFCALFGLALAWHKVKRVPFPVVILGGAAAIGLHALYDLGLFYAAWWSALASLALAVLLNVGVFILLKHAQREDAKLGIGAAGDNLYCRSCGAPNPNHYLYCTTCGGRT